MQMQMWWSNLKNQVYLIYAVETFKKMEKLS